VPEEISGERFAACRKRLSKSPQFFGGNEFCGCTGSENEIQRRENFAGNLN
jgi:hypothetical protein